MKKKLVFVFVLLTLSFFVAPSVFSETVKYGFTFPDGVNGAFRVNPGDVIEGVANIRMFDDASATFRVSFSTMGGNLVAGEGAGTLLDMATWIEFPEGFTYNLTGENVGNNPVPVPFIIRVPDNISPGDYRGILMAKLIREDVPGVTAGAGVSFSTAVGLQLHFFVNGERFHNLDFVDVGFGKFVFFPELGRDVIELQLKYKNLGNSVLSPFVEISANDIWGKNVYEEKFDLGNVFPGSELNKSVLLKELAPFLGWTTISSKLKYNILDFDGGESSESYDSGSAVFKIAIIPWIPVFVFLGVFVLFLFYFTFRSLRISSLRSKSKLYVVVSGDTLQSVCSKFSVDSKYVIIANKLKSPYFLMVGSKIFIPKLK